MIYSPYVLQSMQQCWIL